jgi:hypothetical protein
MDKTAWGVFNDWTYQPVFEINLLIQGWQVFPPLFRSFEKCYAFEKKEILGLLEVWNEKLEMYGGDPSFKNWRRFRPLPMDREEDWSNWFAHLIESSKTGFFSRVLFGLSSLREGSPVTVDREPEHDGCRADLVIKYGNGSHLHVEVKTGDPNLEKTYGTARKMKEYYRSGRTSWADFILILDSQVSQWIEIKDSDAGKISYRTWGNVAIALRRSLLFSNESVLWKSWAYAFLGAIEQKLLNHPSIDVHKKEIRDYYFLDSMLTVLKEGLEDEK